MTVVNVPFRREHLAEMVSQIKDVIYSYSDRISVAEALGCMEIVKAEIYSEARQHDAAI